MMISRLHTTCTPFVILALLVFLAGCGLFEAGEEEYMDMTALAAGRMLFASPPAGQPDGDFSLYTLDAKSTSATISLFITADHNYASPSIVNIPGAFWLVGFGSSRLKTFDTFTREYRTIDGSGAEQRSLVFDRSTPERFAYMDGSATEGYNIVVQPSLDSQPVAVTSGASGSVSYWTPSWSPDGEWILYARIAGSTAAEAKLWRVHPDGSGAEELPIVTTELPTYAVFNPDGTEVLVPGDFTSYYIDDGRVGKIDHLREMATMQDQLAAMGYEFVGSPVTGPVHEGDTVTSVRHGFPLSVYWDTGDWIYFDALVASNYGTPPHQVLGVAIFSWIRISQTLIQYTGPIPLTAERTKDYSVSLMHPTIIP